jgi:preprotein translocase subunit SecB
MVSKFQFENPALLRLNFQVNEAFDTNRIGGFEIQTQFKVRIDRSEGDAKAKVTLTLTISQEDGPFEIDAAIAALFHWDDSIQADMIDRLLKANAPALLVSFLRPIIANITNVSPYPAFNLPFMDFSTGAEVALSET